MNEGVNHVQFTNYVKHKNINMKSNKYITSNGRNVRGVHYINRHKRYIRRWKTLECKNTRIDVLHRDTERKDGSYRKDRKVMCLWMSKKKFFSYIRYG